MEAFNSLATDLGFGGNMLRDQQQDETEEQKRKRRLGLSELGSQLESKAGSLVSSRLGPATMSLFGGMSGGGLGLGGLGGRGR